MTADELIAARTTAWNDDERTALTTVVASLRPSARHLTDALDWLDDIAARDGTRAGAVLAAPGLAAALRSGSSAPERLKRWKERLRRLRYPRLAARERALDDAIRHLALGSTIALAPPADLEGGVLTVTIRARSSAELAAAVERLRERLARGDVERLFALLAEA